MLENITLKPTSLYKIIAVFALGAILCQPTTAGQVYKWTDSEGNVHFSDKKPNYQESESLNIRSSKGSGGNSATPQDKIKQVEEKKAEALEKKAEKLQANQADKKRQENCQIAKNNLKRLIENSRVRIEENGELRYLTPEEVDEKKAKYQQHIDEKCK